MAKASFRKGVELIKLAIQERSVYSHFSDSQHLLIIVSGPVLFSVEFFFKVIPLHREDIWTFKDVSGCMLCMCFPWKGVNTSPLLMLILRGLVKFLLWMESFFPNKINLLEIVLETSVWLLPYPGKQPACSGLRLIWFKGVGAGFDSPSGEVLSSPVFSEELWCLPHIMEGEKIELYMVRECRYSDEAIAHNEQLCNFFTSGGLVDYSI